VSVLIGSSLFGVLGALLAIPVAAAIQITIREVAAFRDTPSSQVPSADTPAPPIRESAGEDPPPAPA